MNLAPMNKRPPTVGRVRAWWGDFVHTWRRIADVHVDLVTAPTEEERWRRLWHFDQRGRRISYPWKDKR